MRASKIAENRRLYEGVEAVIVDMRPNNRGNVTGVIRYGVWRIPRLPEGVSALPKLRAANTAELRTECPALGLQFDDKFLGDHRTILGPPVL